MGGFTLPLQSTSPNHHSLTYFAFGSCMKFCTYELGEPKGVILVSLANMNNVASSSMTNLFRKHTFSREDQSTSHTPNVPKSGTFEHIPSQHNFRVITSYNTGCNANVDFLPRYPWVKLFVSWGLQDSNTLIIAYLPLDGYKNISKLLKNYHHYRSYFILLVNPCNAHIRQYPFMIFNVMYQLKITKC